MATEFTLKQALWLLQEAVEAIDAARHNAVDDDPDTWGEVRSVAEAITDFLEKQKPVDSFIRREGVSND